MSMKVIPFPGRHAVAPVPRERAARFDIKRYPPRAIVTWPEGLAGAISIYALGNTDAETAAIVKALEKALKPRRQ